MVWYTQGRIFSEIENGKREYTWPLGELITRRNRLGGFAGGEGGGAGWTVAKGILQPF